MVLLLEGKHEGFAFMLTLASLFLMFLWIQVLFIEVIPENTYYDIRLIGFYTAVLSVSAMASWAGNWYQEQKGRVQETSTGLLIGAVSMVPIAYGIALVTGTPVIIVTPFTVLALFTFFVVLTFASIEESLFRYSFQKIFGGQKSRWTYYGLSVISSVVFAFFHFARTGFNGYLFVIYFALGLFLCGIFEQTGSFMGICLGHTTYNFIVLGWGLTVPLAVILILFVVLELRG